MPARLSPEQCERAVILYAEGRSLRTVAQMIGCHLETVRKCVKRAGLPLQPRWTRYK